MIKGGTIVILLGAVIGVAFGIGGYTFVYAKGGSLHGLGSSQGLHPQPYFMRIQIPLGSH